MEALRAAVAARPVVQELLELAAQLQACGRCCLRLAAVQDGSAYTSGDLPGSAAGVLSTLRGADEPFTTAHAAEGPAARDSEDPAAASAAKRRRLDDAGLTSDGETAAANNTLPAGNVACGAVVCPLCLGLLQTAVSSGDAATAGASHGLRCSLRLVTTTSTLNDPQRHAAPLFGQAAEGLAVPSAAAAGGDGQGGDSRALAPAVTQHERAVPSMGEAAAAIAAEYDCDSFGIDVSLPASLAVRLQALSWRLRQGDAAQERELMRALSAVIDVKEALRLCFGGMLAAALRKPLDQAAALRISLTASHPDAAAECSWLAASASSGGSRKQHWRGKYGRQQQRAAAGSAEQEVPALTDAVVQRLAAMKKADFTAACPPAAAQLLAPAAPASVQVQARRRPVHVGGRYLKLRRGIPQSPWIIDGQRKGEGSVQEAIERAVLPAFQADTYTFVSAGREDIDVRMLGGGRPFILQIENARRATPAPQALQAMEASVLEESAGGVAVRGLFAATPAQLAQLKEGEQEKEKSYAAVCWVPRPLSNADVAALQEVKDLEVMQQTPIRVLHRRANLERPKVVHQMAVHRLPAAELAARAHAGQQASACGAAAGSSPGSYFLLRLRTQAGTYIKEFVHGDLGRTRPSVGDLLGGCKAQIVSLDVEQVHMPFGPQADEQQEQPQEQQQGQ